MKRTVTRWIKRSPLGPLATWAWRRVAPAPPPEMPENANETMYAFMRRVLRDDCNCVDIGASFGGYLEQMLSIAPRGSHHAFEPIPALAEDLRRKFPAEHVHVHAMALSDTAGSAQFHYFPDVSPFSGLKRRGDIAYDERAQVIDVPVARLDDVLPPPLAIALLKIDVEGAELNVLHGARRTIETFRPPLILEHDVGPATLYGATSDMIHDFVSGELGYVFTTSVRAMNGDPPMSRQEFLDTARGGKIYNFVAMPKG